MEAPTDHLQIECHPDNQTVIRLDGFVLIIDNLTKTANVQFANMDSVTILPCGVRHSFAEEFTDEKEVWLLRTNSDEKGTEAK